MAAELLRVGLTGAGGFIGAHLLRALEACGRVRVRVLTRSPRTGHLTASGLKPQVKDLDAVFHLGGVNRGTDREILEANVLGTWHLLEALRVSGNLKAHVLFASSGQMYPPSAAPIRETRKIVPPTVYGLSKHAAEELIRLSGRPSSLLRLSNVYGPGCRAEYNSVIATFCRQAARGEALTLHGRGEQGRDFLYIDDAVAGFLAAAFAPPAGRALNLSSGRITTLRQVTARLRRLMPGLKLEYRPGESTGPAAYCLDNSRFCKRYGWRPRVALATGLARTLDGFRGE